MTATLVDAVLALGSWFGSLAVLGLIVLVWHAHSRIDELEQTLHAQRPDARTDGGEDR